MVNDNFEVANIFAIIKRNHVKMYMFGVVRETHAHDCFDLLVSFFKNCGYFHVSIKKLKNTDVSTTFIINNVVN